MHISGFVFVIWDLTGRTLHNAVGSASSLFKDLNERVRLDHLISRKREKKVNSSHIPFTAVTGKLYSSFNY